MVKYTEILLDPSKFEFRIVAIYRKINKLLSYIKENGIKDNKECFLEFLSSKYYKTIPEVDISAKLYAKLFTQTSQIKPGDAMDLNHISSIFPYCSILLTDRKMYDHIKELELDNKYNALVFCLREYESLVEILNLY